MKAKWVIACSLLLFCMACSMTALEFRKNESEAVIWPGIATLCLGLLGPLIGCFAWFANPFWFVALILLYLQRNVPAAVCAGLALLISCNTWVLFSCDIPGDEGGMSKLILQRIGEGTYLWMASMAVVLVGAFLVPRRLVDPMAIRVVDRNNVE
ncbi:MAG: putative rane protein [Planctomycetaceae bacterium]|nr:putative rane protein [Planctomycetaceae bacterium]